MAQRRMFSSRITNSGRFLTMPPSSQALYFHLGLHADDDGVVEAHTVIKLTDSKPDDYNCLVAKRFIYPLNEDLVVVILDWREHNLIRADRKIDSIYKGLLLEKLPTIELLEPRQRADSVKIYTGRPVDNQMTAQVRLGKVRLGKEITHDDFERFWKEYPRKIGKPAALRAWTSLKPSKEETERIVSSIASWKTTSQWCESDRYIPHPATFLNQRRFDDEISVPTELPKFKAY